MRKVPPSDVLREQINRSLTGGVEDGTELLSHLAHLGLGYLVQQALEQEQEDFLGRGRYERREEGIGDQPARYRNGYEQGRLRTAEGEVSVRVPQVRGASTPYRSRLMEFLSGNSPSLGKVGGGDVRQGALHQGRGGVLSGRAHRGAYALSECGLRDHRPFVGGLPRVLQSRPLRHRG
jgi:Transposase, Mutator family